MAVDFDTWLRERICAGESEDGRLSPGTVVGEFRIEAFLGRGGFADVYRAGDAQGKPVAVKLLHRLDGKSRQRFARESRILAQVRHRNLPVFLGFGTCGERPYVVTEFLHAQALPNRDREVARFLDAVMAAAEELHRHGFVHRDITPANILRRADGEPVLIDFGLAVPASEALREQAALSVENEKKVAVGTLGFSAPEQFAGLVSGPASDIHALGALVGACFGGRMPRCWKRIYLTATNSNPRIRYQSVAALRRAVALRHVGWVVLSLVCVIVLGVFAYMVSGEVRERRFENRAPHRFQEKGWK